MIFLPDYEYGQKMIIKNDNFLRKMNSFIEQLEQQLDNLSTEIECLAYILQKKPDPW